MTTFEKTIGINEFKSGYLNLKSDDGIRHGKRFPPAKTSLTIITNNRQYPASMNSNSNQIWGALRRWYKDENVFAGDKIRITFDPLKENIDGRIVIEISLLKRNL